MAFRFPSIDPTVREETPRGPAGEAQARAWARHYLTDEDAYGTTLYAAALQILSPDDLMNLDPQTIRLELRDEFRVDILPENFDRLMAIITAVHTDLFYRDVAAFIEICNILGGTPPDADVFDPADSYEMAWAIAEVRSLDQADDVSFSIDVRAYIGMMLSEEGYISPPPLLAVAEMPSAPALNDITGDAELASAIVQGDQERHETLMAAIKETYAEMLQQLQHITGKLGGDPQPKLATESPTKLKLAVSPEA